MAIIVNAYNNEEYNQKIHYYQANGFKLKSSSAANIQTHLEKKNFGPLILHVILIVSVISSLVFLSDLAVYCLAISDFFIKLNFFSLLVSIRYLQDIGLILLILSIILILVIVYYYFTQPYEVIVRLNQSNYQVNNNFGFNNNGGNYNG